MSQPKKPPLSIRLGAATEANLADYAARRQLSRNAAIDELINLGLAMDDQREAARLAESAKPAAAKAKAAAVKTEAPPKAAFKSRLKGEWKAP